MDEAKKKCQLCGGMKLREGKLGNHRLTFIPRGNLYGWDMKLKRLFALIAVF